MNYTRLLTLILPIITTIAPIASHAQTSEVKGISVAGECLKKVTQDRGGVSLGTTALAEKAGDAAEQTIKAHEKMKAEVGKLALRDFTAETENYGVSQECSYEEGKRKCTGFRATLSTRFETSDIARLGDIVAIGAKHNSQEVSQLSTFVSPEKMKAERESCLEIATKNAAAKAQKLANGAGVRLGAPQSILEATDMGTHPPYPIARTRALSVEANMEATMVAPTVDAKAQDIQVSVKAVYGIE
jgi:uncharacterized protein YggE